MGITRITVAERLWEMFIVLTAMSCSACAGLGSEVKHVG
jgi:hypothetical protein